MSRYVIVPVPTDDLVRRHGIDQLYVVWDKRYKRRIPHGFHPDYESAQEWADQAEMRSRDQP